MSSNVWEWVQQVCEAADTSAKRGDLSLVNRFDGAWSFYYTNVHKMRTVTPMQFMALYPQYAEALQRDHRDYLREENASSVEDRLSSIEKALNDIQAAIAALTAAPAEEAKPLAPPEEKRKPGRPKKAAPPPPEDEDEDEDETEDEDESGG